MNLITMASKVWAKCWLASLVLFFIGTPVFGNTLEIVNISKSESLFIGSPGFPGAYGDNLLATWLIHVPEGMSALLEFSHFSVEYDCDFLKVGFGSEPGLEETRLITLSGEELPTAGEWEKVKRGTDGIRTRHQTSWLQFITDSITEETKYNGFYVNVSAIDEGVDYRPYIGFENFKNKIHLPNYKGGSNAIEFPVNTLVSYVFEAREGASIGMYLKGFQTTDRSAILYFGEGKEVGKRDTVIHRLVDTIGQFDAFPVESKDRWMWVMFTNSYRNNAEQSGFKLRITEIKPEIILTPENPYNFTFNASRSRVPDGSKVFSATWNVRAPPGTSIRISFLQLEMDINLDFFMVGDGWTYLRYEQYRYAVSAGRCHRDTSGARPLDDVIINLSRVFIGFYGYDSGADSVIVAQLSVAEKDGIDYPLDESLPGAIIPVSPHNMTRVTSPNYPNQYPHSSIMTWVLRAPPLYRFNVHFDKFKLEEGLDKLSMGSGTAPFAETSEELTVSESATDVTDVLLDDRAFMQEYMWIKLESDQLGVDGRFAFNITAVIDPIVIAKGKFEMLRSPYYPLPYENEAYVKWKIEVPDGHSVMLHFIKFHLIDSGDTLVIEDALLSAKDSIPAVFTGVDVPSDYVLWSTEALIRFESNSFGVGEGFNIKVQPIFGEGHCLTPLGFEGGWIPDESVHASTQNDSNHTPSHARLHGPSAWIPSPNDPEPQLTITLKTLCYVTGAVIQSGPDSTGNWVDSFIFSFDPDEETEEIEGDWKSKNVYRLLFVRPHRANLIRINPQSRSAAIFSFRLELLGCRSDCYFDLGLSSGHMPDESIKIYREGSIASEAPDLVRMLPVQYSPSNGLSSGVSDDDLTVRIDFDTTTLVKAIIIQRREGSGLKKFTFQYDNQSQIEFDISDCDLRVCKKTIEKPLAATSVTISKLEWTIAGMPHFFRFELLGCITVDCITPYCTDDCNLNFLASKNAREIASSRTTSMPARSTCELDIPEKDDMFITFILLGFHSDEDSEEDGSLEINEPGKPNKFSLGSSVPPVFVSSSPTVSVRILTGISTAHPDVTVTYGYTDKPGCYSDKDETVCKGTGGIIMSKNYFNDYPDGVKEHTWTIITSLWTKVILTFIEIDVYSLEDDCDDDYVNVTDYSQVNVYCNVDEMSAEVESSSNWMKIKFHSDAQDTKGHTGFLGEYKTELLTPEFSQPVDNQSYTCPDSWDVFHGFCYSLFRLSEDITWTDAEQKCKDKQAHLVSIRDQDEMKFLHFMISSDKWNSTQTITYIGLGSREKYGVFRWTDGTPMSYTAWAKQSDSDLTDRQPDGASLEACVKLVLNQESLTDLSFDMFDLWHDVACAATETSQFICERPADRVEGSFVDEQFPVYKSDVDDNQCGPGLYHCSSGECINEVFICDSKDDCNDRSDENDCPNNDECLPNQFQCTDGACIASAFFCDTIVLHCLDNSDETACNYPDCRENEFTCDSNQCIDASRRCDFIDHCFDGSDEIGCEKKDYNVEVFQCYDGTLLPAEVHCDGLIDCIGNTHEDEKNCPNQEILDERKFYCPEGALNDVSFKCMYDFNEYGLIKGCRNVEHLKDCRNANDTCPENTMRCPNSYCIPLRYRCDGKEDCQYGEDEKQCDSFNCPEGTYHCKSKSSKGLCISPDHVCDGVIHCPDGDDEINCYKCPIGCECNDLSYTCNLTVEVSRQLPRQLRKLSVMLINETTESNTRALRPIYDDPEPDVFIPSMWPYLIYLDISHSEISELKPGAFDKNRNVRHLHLHENQLRELHEGSFRGLEQLRFLNLSRNNLHDIHSGTFSNLSKLQELDIRGNDNIAYAEESQRNIFVGLENFKLYTDKYLFCCMAKVEDINCEAPRDQFSSCTDLMENVILRALMWILGFSAFVGNAFVIGYRLTEARKERKKNNVQASLITNLAISDFLMGLYMLTIASADTHFRGTYIYQADYWTSSTLCQITGMVSVISSEASVFLVMMISLDRCVHVVAPFKRGLHMSQRSSHLIETGIWVLAFMLGLLPILIPSYFKDEFYGTSGVCLALPLTTERPAGWHYSISIFIGANFVCFLVTFLCYVAIFMSVKTSQRQVAKGSAAMGREDKRLKEEIKLATKMALIVGTDLVCWMPIIIMGVLSAAGTPLPAEVYAWTAVIILPINSSLNPYLYTISTVHSQHLNKLRLRQEAAETKTRESVNFELTTSLITPFTSLPSPLPQRMRTWLQRYSRDLTNDELEIIERDVIEAVSSMKSEGVKIDEFLHVENLAIQVNNAGKISQAFIVLDVPLPLANGKSKVIDDDEKPKMDGPMTRNLLKLQTMFDRVAIRKSTNKL